MIATRHRWGKLVRRAALSTLAMVAVSLPAGIVQAQSGPGSPLGALCEDTSPDRVATRCKWDAAVGDRDEPADGDTDGSQARDHDDLDARSKQIETMNQQLRMERRRKDSLLHLYPDEAAHNAARVHDLEAADKPIRAAEDRVEDLTRERRRLGQATGLYAGKPLPSNLRTQSQNVEAALQQATALLRNRREERVLVSKNYDEELAVLRKLWAAQSKT